MGIEKTRTSLNNENIQKFSVPPGFVSLTSFTLKKETTNDEACKSMAEAEPSCMDSTPTIIDFAKVEKHRPWILHNELGYNQKGSDPQLEMNFPLRACLPKGVIRGCSSCPNCQKVISRWHPEESCQPVLEEAPVFHPTEEEFKDTLKYIASIRLKAEHFGICRIVPPPSWQPPCLLREKSIWENSKFETHIERVDELKNLYSNRKLGSIDEHMTVKRRRVSLCSTEHQSSNVCTTNDNSAPCHDESSKSESGPEFTLQDFEKYADDFKSQYFCGEDKAIDLNVSSTGNRKRREPSVENIEGEYWRIIENPSEEIEVLCGINVSSREFGSGFPVDSNSFQMPKYLEYTDLGWNLNNTPKLPGSLLIFENSDTSSASIPKLFMGMCFSSLCWKVEEHHLYSLCYMHLGSPKIWYGIPARYCYKFEGVVKKHLRQYSERPELLWKLITLLPPSVLTSEGIPVYRCMQSPREFVVTFPGAYHCEFDCGFNCSERVNFAPFDWLPYGQHVVELYSEQCRKTTISHDKLLLGAAMVAVRAKWELSVMRSKLLDNIQWINICGKDGILTKLLKLRIKQEVMRREYLCNSFDSRKMADGFDLTSKRECSICHFDLHCSAIGCSCSPGKYTCLQHANHLCSCASDAKCLLFRYEINELNVLVKALEGNLEAVKKWGIEKLGLTMSSNVSTEAVELTVPNEVSGPVEPVTSSAASPSLRYSARVKMEEPLRQQTSEVEHKEKKNVAASFSVQRDIVIILSDEEDEETM